MYVSISEPPPMTHTEPFTATCHKAMDPTLAQKRLFVRRVIVGVIANTISMVARIRVFTGSKNRFENAIIDTGSKYCSRLSSVSLGIKTAIASSGEKLGGNPINLLAINNATNNTKFLNTYFPCLIFVAEISSISFSKCSCSILYPTSLPYVIFTIFGTILNII